MKENESTQDLIRIFSQHNISDLSMNKIMKISKVFGNDAAITVEKDPYSLLKIHGLGFMLVDRIGQAMNANPLSAKRIAGAFNYVLEWYSLSGHTCMPKQDLLDKTYKLLNISVPREKFETMYEALRSKGVFIESDGLVFSKMFWKCERELAEKIKYFAELDGREDMRKVKKYINEFSDTNIFPLDDSQKAVEMAFSRRFAVITGGPGTGKSTIVKCMLWVNKQLRPEDEPCLITPTGRAARRLSEVTEHTARTIHSKLHLVENDSGGYFEPEPIDNPLVIVDETSMVDTVIAHKLFSALDATVRIVLVGDVDQLPSVGAGQVLKDIIDSGINVYRLNTIHRQDKDSLIIQNADAINKGEIQSLRTGKDFVWVKSAGEEELIQKATNLYMSCVKKAGIDNVMLLCPYRQKTSVCCNTLSLAIQRAYLGEDVMNDKKALTIPVGEFVFHKGDRVIQTKNTDNAQNGDVGIIHAIRNVYDKENAEFKVVAEIEFNNDGNILEYQTEDMQNIALAYSVTVHKSQGSEYETVLFVSTPEHEMFLRRNLLYTAVTRASKNFAVIGSMQSFCKGISNDNIDIRYTGLKKKICKK